MFAGTDNLDSALEDNIDELCSNTVNVMSSKEKWPREEENTYR